MSLQPNTENINWQDEKSHLLLNPRLPDSEKNAFITLAENWQQPAHIWICSSGSSQTADVSAKLIALSKKAILTAASSVNDFLRVTTADSWLNPLPLFHVGGLSILARSNLSGSSCIQFEEKWNAQNFVKKLAEHKITLTSLVPAQVFDLVQRQLQAPKELRALLVGAGALNQDLYLQARKLGWPLLPSFGMTETAALFACAPLSSLSQENFPELVVLPHVQVKLSEDKKLMLCSDSLLTGYGQVKNGEVRWVAPIQNGWYQTDDLAEIKTRQDVTYLQPQGRVAEYLKIKGEGVSLNLLRQKLDELILNNSPNLFQKVTLFATPSIRDQHEITLIHERKLTANKLDAHKIEELFKQFNQSVMPYERATKLFPVDNIPVTELGKINWSKLRTENHE